MAPYASLEPQLVFVVEDADGVAGFVAGSEDTEVGRRRRSPADTSRIST